MATGDQYYTVFDENGDAHLVPITSRPPPGTTPVVGAVGSTYAGELPPYPGSPTAPADDGSGSGQQAGKPANPNPYGTAGDAGPFAGRGGWLAGSLANLYDVLDQLDWVALRHPWPAADNSSLAARAREIRATANARGNSIRIVVWEQDTYDPAAAISAANADGYIGIGPADQVTGELVALMSTVSVPRAIGLGAVPLTWPGDTVAMFEQFDGDGNPILDGNVNARLMKIGAKACVPIIGGFGGHSLNQWDDLLTGAGYPGVGIYTIDQMGSGNVPNVATVPVATRPGSGGAVTTTTPPPVPPTGGGASQTEAQLLRQLGTDLEIIGSVLSGKPPIDITPALPAYENAVAIVPQIKISDPAAAPLLSEWATVKPLVEALIKPAPPTKNYCFQWGPTGLKWGKDYPGWTFFKTYLEDVTHDNPDAWIDQHPAAAECIGATKSAGPPPPTSSQFCFSMFGRKWGGKDGLPWDSFKLVLENHLIDVNTWIVDNPAKAECIGAPHGGVTPLPPGKILPGPDLTSVAAATTRATTIFTTTLPGQLAKARRIAATFDDAVK